MSERASERASKRNGCAFRSRFAQIHLVQLSKTNEINTTFAHQTRLNHKCTFHFIYDILIPTNAKQQWTFEATDFGKYIHIVMQHTKQIAFTVCAVCAHNAQNECVLLLLVFSFTFFFFKFETSNECFNWKEKQKWWRKPKRAQAHLVHGKTERFNAQFYLFSSDMLAYWETTLVQCIRWFGTDWFSWCTSEALCQCMLTFTNAHTSTNTISIDWAMTYTFYSR